MSKRKKTRAPAERTPAPAGGAARRARAGRKWLPLVLLSVCFGIGAVLILDPFSGEEEAAPRPEKDSPRHYPPGPLTAEGLEKEALEAAQQLVADFPGQPTPLSVMGTACVNFLRPAEALSWYQRALGLAPGSAYTHLMMAEAYAQKTETEQAVEWYRKALEIDPNIPNANEKMGKMLLDLGQPEEAVKALEAERRLFPNAVGINLPLAEAYLELRQYERALPYLETMAGQEPGKSHTFHMLGKAYARLGQREKAKAAQETFRTLRAREDEVKLPTHKEGDLAEATQRTADAHTAVGGFYAGQGQLKLAEDHLRRAAFLDRENQDCRLRLCNLYRHGGRWDQALVFCKELVRLDPNNARYHVNESIAYSELRQFKKAERALRNSLRLAPGNIPVYHSLLKVLVYGTGDLSGAKTVAETLVDLEPTAKSYLKLSEVLQRAGDRAGGLAAMERAAQLAPGNAGIQQAYRALKERR